MLKILIAGSRDFNNVNLMRNILDKFFPEPFHLISGGAKGADKLSENYLLGREGCFKTIIPANWDLHGKSAGYIRNKKMFEENPNIVVVFWDGKSKGTKHTLNLAKEHQIPTLIIYF